MKKLLIIIKKEPEPTFAKMIEKFKASCSVEVTDLRKNKDYKQLLEKIFDSDQVISW